MMAYIDGRFSVPENPVMRGLNGFGVLQVGNGYAFGQSVDVGTAPALLPFNPPAAFYAGGDVTSNPNGAGWSSARNDGTQWTPDFCNQIIQGKTQGSDVDKFQCSIRGYVGNSPAVASIPPALVPDPPTSVTIPAALARVANPPPQRRPQAMTQCASAGSGPFGLGGNRNC